MGSALQSPATTDRLAELRLALNPKQCAFVDHYLNGEPAYKAYLAAYPDTNDHVARASSSRLLKTNANVVAYVKAARLIEHQANSLTREEKRSFLADVVRTPIEDIVAGDGSIAEGMGCLVQEILRSTDKDGNPVTRVKLPPKLDAIRVDNKMNGDDAPIEVKHSISGLLESLPSSIDLPSKRLV